MSQLQSFVFTYFMIIMLIMLQGCTSRQYCERYETKEYVSTGTPKFSYSNIKNIAVLVEPRDVAAKLSEKIVKYSKYRVVERSKFDYILKEQGLATTGFIDPIKAAEIGEMAGADALVMGKITVQDRDRYGNETYGSDLRFVDTAAGSILWMESYPSAQVM